MNTMNQLTKGIGLTAAFAVFFTIGGCGQKIGKSKNTSESTEFFKEIGSTAEENAESQTTETGQNAVVDTTAHSPIASSTLSSSPEKPSARDIQQALKNGNFYQGKVDGVLGPKTKKAIEDFQTQNNLKVDGKVGSQTWQKLKAYYNSSSIHAESSVSAKMTETPQQSSSPGIHD